MPELPEVETIVRELRTNLLGKELRDFLVRDPKILKPKLSFPLRLIRVHRHGKYIVFDFNKGVRSLVHLRMTGEMLLSKSKGKIVLQKPERAAFVFGSNNILKFIDVRRFGTIEWRSNRELPSLGPDPLSKKITPRILENIFKTSSRSIKSALLDQAKISGIGNIYADEGLWFAKIHPETKSGTLTLAEIGRILISIRRVLREGIKKGGFTLRDYKHIDGSSGYYQKSRKVYNREGEPCPRCRATIKRIKVAGRGTHFCPLCQK